MFTEFTVDRDLYPFESRWFTARRGTLHYIDEGAGPTIVFFHGNPTWSFLYRNIIIELRTKFRCIAVDYFGFGLSEHPDDFGYSVEEHASAIGELIDHLELTDFLTMGQDWGGPISMAVATARHERVRGVVLGNTWIWPSDEWRLRLFATIAAIRPVHSLLMRSNVMVEFIRYATKATLTDAVMRHYRGVQPTTASRRGIAEFPVQIGAARPLLSRLARDVPDRLGSKPALFIWGMRDPAFRPAPTLRRLTEIFPDNVVVRLTDASHFIQEEAPDAVADAIMQRFG